jgi:hypothetical protein
MIQGEVPELKPIVNFLQAAKQPLRYYVAAAFGLEELWLDCPDFYKELIVQHIFNTQNWTPETWQTFLNQLMPQDANLWGNFYSHKDDLQWFYAYFDIPKLSEDYSEALVIKEYNGGVKVVFLRIFNTAVQDVDLRKIGDYAVRNNTIAFRGIFVAVNFSANSHHFSGLLFAFHIRKTINLT